MIYVMEREDLPQLHKSQRVKISPSRRDEVWEQEAGAMELEDRKEFLKTKSKS